MAIFAIKFRVPRFIIPDSFFHLLSHSLYLNPPLLPVICVYAKSRFPLIC